MIDLWLWWSSEGEEALNNPQWAGRLTKDAEWMVIHDRTGLEAREDRGGDCVTLKSCRAMFDG